jgi:hypothetical protein
MTNSNHVPVPEYKNELAFNQGKNAFLGRKEKRNPYARCRDSRRLDWDSGYLYQQKVYYKLLMEAEGKEYND